MYLYALICALVAIVCFIWSARPHLHATVTNWLAVGLAFTVAAGVLQVVTTTGWRWTIT